jgi:hypothetical protein
MRAPHDTCTPTDEVTGQTGGLGVMEEDDIAGFDPVGQCGHICIEDRAVVEVSLLTELLAIPWRSVQTVVYSLGDGEELCIVLDDDPAGCNPQVVRIAN